MYKSMTQQMLFKIEDIFGFELYDWQKAYLTGLRSTVTSHRCKGNTFAYCLRLLLCNTEDIVVTRKQDLMKYSDRILDGPMYQQWFINYLLDINKTLIDSGIETCLKFH